MIAGSHAAPRKKWRRISKLPNACIPSYPIETSQGVPTAEGRRPPAMQASVRNLAHVRVPQMSVRLPTDLILVE